MLSTRIRPQPTRSSAAVAQLAVQDLCKFKVAGSTPVSGLNSLPDSSAVEQRTVNAPVPGSIPGLAVVELKRIGKRSVLKTDALTGCGFESMPVPPFRQRCFVSSNSMGLSIVWSNASGFDPVITRSNRVAPVTSCQSSSGPRPRVVVPVTRIRIPFGTPSRLVSVVATAPIATRLPVGSIPTRGSLRERSGGIALILPRTIGRVTGLSTQTKAGSNPVGSLCTVGHGVQDGSNPSGEGSIPSRCATAPSSSGSGCCPVTAATRVQIPLGLPITNSRGTLVTCEMAERKLAKFRSEDKKPSLSRRQFGKGPVGRGSNLLNCPPARVVGPNPTLSVCLCGDCGQHDPLKRERIWFDSRRWHSQSKLSPHYRRAA